MPVVRPIESFETAERVHRLSRKIMDHNEVDVMSIALRAVRARDPNVLWVCERMAEWVTAEAEKQFGETIRDGSRVNCLPPEAKVWQRAYEHADRGDPVQAFAAMYGAAAVWSGVAHMDGVL